jgi:hypothetical protein
MRDVLSSAAEAELGTLFHNGKEACPLRIALEEMGHPQPATPMATDNSTAIGIATNSVKQNAPQPLTCAFTGYAIVCVRAISNLLAQGLYKPRQLFFQTSSGLPSSGHPFYVLVFVSYEEQF